jgi:hypothetical protein
VAVGDTALRTGAARLGAISPGGLVPLRGAAAVGERALGAEDLGRGTFVTRRRVVIAPAGPTLLAGRRGFFG